MENRDWPANFRGRLLIHAGLTMTRKYYDQVVQELDGMGLLPADLPPMKNCSAAALWAGGM